MSKRRINREKRTQNAEQAYDSMVEAQVARLDEIECIHGKVAARNCDKCTRRALNHPNLKRAQRRRNAKRRDYQRKRAEYA